MAAGAQGRGWSGPTRRRVPRFRVEAPLDVTVLRSGIPDTVPGRSVNVCERGIAAMLAGDLTPGETVGVEVHLSPATEPLRSRAMVRYQDMLRYGLEFVAMSAEQQKAIREWAKEVKAETESSASAAEEVATEDAERRNEESAYLGGRAPGRPKRKRRKRGWIAWMVLAVVVGAVSWWKWNSAWKELESGRKSSQTAYLETPRVQVPAEVMQRLLVHRVEPVYPAEARGENLQGIIALDVVVARDGSVQSMRALNGPEVLARAAMDALRWWKFEPYRVNGEPAVVETTVAVEFKR